MKMKGLEEFLRFVKDRAYNLNIRRGYKVYVSVFFIKEGQRSQIIDNKERKALSDLVDSISYQNPEKIEVVISSNGQTQTYNYDLTYSNDNTNYRQYSSNNESNRQMTKTNERNEISGLGNINHQSIENIVNKRLEEERKERLLSEQKTTIDEKNEIITKKTKEIESLASTLESKNEEIEDLQKNIESKQNLKYYAGITGDILQSFGIKKDFIATPLAGLFGANKQQEPRAIQQNTITDESGIIDEEISNETSTDIQNKRNEMIALIGEYLQGVDNPTLTNIFSIFSEIENNPQNAISILEHLNNQKKTNN